jgi:low affinity Fe/Cu permease
MYIFDGSSDFFKELKASFGANFIGRPSVFKIALAGILISGTGSVGAFCTAIGGLSDFAAFGLVCSGGESWAKVVKGLKL